MKVLTYGLLLATVSATAQAQSSLTIFGVMDLLVANGKGSDSSKLQLASTGISATRIGFRGVEDLGGGLYASFWLEAGFFGDNGTGQATNTNNQTTGTSVAPAGTQGLNFNRRSTVSLRGSGGELRLGRDYTPQFWNYAVFDPFGGLGTGGNLSYLIAITGPTQVRASNSIGYFFPTGLGGFYGQAMYYLGENPTGNATSKDGSGGGVRLGYANGPINVAGSLSRTKFAAGDVYQNSVGGSYDLGLFQLIAKYDWDKNSARLAGSRKAKAYLLGANISSRWGLFKVAYSTYRIEPAQKTAKIALGYQYDLSKRTAVYTAVARQRNSGGAAVGINGAVTGPNKTASGWDVGLRHTF